MKRENKVVAVGNTPEEKCPTYEKCVPETFAEAFSLIPNAKYTKEQSDAIFALDGLFPDTQKKDKDGKDVVIINELRDDFLGHFSYGFDLYMKAKTRREFEKTLEDPGKPVVQAIKGMIASGFDAKMAYDLVKAQRDSKSLETPAFDQISSKL